MARAFTSASSHKLQNDNAAVANVPLTLACWARTSSTATTQAIMAVGQRATNAQRYQIFFNSSGRLAAYCQNGAGTQVSNVADSSGVNYAANTWYHIAGVFSSTTSRTIYRDGGSSNTDTTSVTVGTVTTTNIGTRFDGASFGTYLNGQVAEAGIWDVALTAAEIASLAKGLSPLMVRPESLVAYWPLYGNSSPESDWVGAFPLTVTGATKAAHVRIIYPAFPKIFLPAASGTTYNQALSASVARSATLGKTLSLNQSMSTSVTRTASLTASSVINQAMSAAVTRTASIATQFFAYVAASYVKIKGVSAAVKSAIKAAIKSI